jgi:putative transposase
MLETWGSAGWGRTFPVILVAIEQDRRCNAGREGTPVSRVMKQDPAAEGDAGSAIDEIVREGARQMLAAAVQAEVAAYIAVYVGEVDEHGHRLVVRNGFTAPRTVMTAAGSVAGG